MCRPLLTRLPDLELDLLALVADALALVGVGLAQLADVGGDLADLLLVDAAYDELRRALHLEADPLGGRDGHRVAVAERELEVGAPRGDAVADAADLHRLCVAVGHADDHVGDQAAGQAVQAPALALVVGPVDLERAVLGALDRDRLRDGVGQGALGALHRHRLAVEGDLDAGRDGDGQAADSRHAGLLVDVGEDFPTHALLVGLAVGQQAARRRDDRDAEATEDLGEVASLRVDAQAGLGDATDTGDGPLAVRAVLEVDREDLALLA